MAVVAGAIDYGCRMQIRDMLYNPNTLTMD